MKGKIIYLSIIFLLIFGSIVATGLKNYDQNFDLEFLDESEKGVKTMEHINNGCINCQNFQYSFGMLDSPLDLLKLDNCVDISGDPPDSWDWRNATYNGINGNWISPVRDQGKCGSCGSFAAIACFESAYKLYIGNPNLDVDFSEQYMVSCGKEWIGDQNLFVRMRGCNGATLLGVLEFIKEYGAINESCFPYISGEDGFEPPCSDKCESWNQERIMTKKYKVVKTDYVRKGIFISDTNPKNIKNALVQYGPLTTGFLVFEDFLNYSGGVYELNRSKPWNLLGGHGALIVGYKDDPSIDSGGYWICKNSWGSDWGEDGFFRIKYDDFYKWYYKEYLGRLRNIKNLRDFIDFYLWCSSLVAKGIPVVGIDYACGFFTGITKDFSNNYESYYTPNHNIIKNSGIFNPQTISFNMNKSINVFQLAVKLISL